MNSRTASIALPPFGFLRRPAPWQYMGWIKKPSLGKGYWIICKEAEKSDHGEIREVVSYKYGAVVWMREPSNKHSVPKGFMKKQFLLKHGKKRYAVKIKVGKSSTIKPIKWSGVEAPHLTDKEKAKLRADFAANPTLYARYVLGEWKRPSPSSRHKTRRKPSATRMDDWKNHSFCVKCQVQIPKNHMFCKKHEQEIDRISGGFFSKMRNLEMQRDERISKTHS